jgi:hypothetical protein
MALPNLLVMVILMFMSCCCAISTVVAQTAASPAPAPAADPNEGNATSIGWYKAHGWLLWTAFGVFFPVGTLLSRYGQYRLKWWFEAHLALQVLGVITSTIGVAIAFNKFDALNDEMTHTKLGVAIMVLVWVQVLLSVIRPKRGKVSRVPWYFIHWLFGTTAVLLAWYNIFKGLDLYVTSWTVGTQKVGTYHPNHENPNLIENIIQTVHNLRNLPEKFCTLTFIFQASNVRTVC